MTKNDVKIYTKSIKNLSTIPGLLHKMLAVAQHEGFSANDLLKLISHDQALAEKVVRVANSAFFGHSGEVKDLRQAFIFLGVDKIRSIALGMTVMDIFPARSSFNVKNLWRHGYEVAILSEAISGIVCATCPQECFLAGLLHDIGRIILYQMDPSRYTSLSSSGDLLTAEEEVFGCTHQDAGAWFAEENGLPPEIVSVIRHHHAPSRSREYRDAAAIVSLAEALSRRFPASGYTDGTWSDEHDIILFEYSLTDDDTLVVGERFCAEKPDIDQFFATA